MRLLLVALGMVACKPDLPPAPSPVAREARAAPRRATLPLPTTRNALRIGKQLRAETAWAEAATEENLEAWDAAAEAFTDAHAACEADCTELAYTAVLARANALKLDGPRPAERPVQPQALSPRVQGLIDAADAFVAAAPDSDEAAGVAFIASNQYNDHGWIDESTHRYADIIAQHPRHEVAEYAANLMLDAYNRSERHDDLVRWAQSLAANRALMAAHPALAQTVRTILSVAGG